MASEAALSARILVHGERVGDLEPIEALLGEVGADFVEVTSADHLGRLLEGDEIDLALADAGWEVSRLEDLLRTLDELGGGREVPVILLAPPGELSEWVRRSAKRFHVTLLDRPAGRDLLGSALRAGLALRAQRRGRDDLLGELRRANAELDRRRREAEAETRRRIWLMAAISHHLRTPVHEVALSAHLLRASGCDQIPPEDWAALTDGLHDGVEWLRELVDDLVDIAQLDLGTMAFHEVAFPVGPFLERTLESHKSDAAAKGLNFRLTLDAPGAVARTDPEKLARILRNLASNAVKFTEAGEVAVEVRTGDGLLVAAVRDTGCGIGADKLEGIFDEFAQLANPERDRNKGTGLGLALCRRLVGALNGHLHVRSTLGEGSTFTVTLPCQIVADDWSGPQPEAGISPQSAGLA